MIWDRIEELLESNFVWQLLAHAGEIWLPAQNLPRPSLSCPLPTLAAAMASSTYPCGSEKVKYTSYSPSHSAIKPWRVCVPSLVRVFSTFPTISSFLCRFVQAPNKKWSEPDLESAKQRLTWIYRVRLFFYYSVLCRPFSDCFFWTGVRFHRWRADQSRILHDPAPSTWAYGTSLTSASDASGARIHFVQCQDITGFFIFWLLKGRKCQAPLTTKSLSTSSWTSRGHECKLDFCDGTSLIETSGMGERFLSHFWWSSPSLMIRVAISFNFFHHVICKIVWTSQFSRISISPGFATFLLMVQEL